MGQNFVLHLNGISKNLVTHATLIKCESKGQVFKHMLMHDDTRSQDILAVSVGSIVLVLIAMSMMTIHFFIIVIAWCVLLLNKCGYINETSRNDKKDTCSDRFIL